MTTMRAADPEPAATERPAVSDRITVALIERARTDLAGLREATGLSITDIANRAISLYAWVEAQMAAGKQLIVKDPATDEATLVRFL